MSTFGLSLIDATIEEYLEDQSIAKHTFNDFNLKMVSMYIPMPETKEQKVNLPFASGSVDLTEAGGTTPYADRDGLQFEFVYFGDLMNWPLMTHNLANYLHGKKLLMIADNDLQYYYVVRLELDTQKTSKHANKVVLSGSAEPFKYSLVGTSDPWRWDPFSFVDGHIVSTADIVVDGQTDVTIEAGGQPNSPYFIVSDVGAGLGVIYNTNPPRTLPMTQTGTYRFPQIKAGGENVTTVSMVCHGIVSISYRKRFL